MPESSSPKFQGITITNPTTGELYLVPSLAASMVAGSTYTGLTGTISGGIPYAIEGALKAPAGGRIRQALLGMRTGGLAWGSFFGSAGVLYVPVYFGVRKTGINDRYVGYVTSISMAMMGYIYPLRWLPIGRPSCFVAAIGLQIISLEIVGGWLIRSQIVK
ncbi:hypothetical protein J3R30DRAFT_3701809 [Lentinula aciculospora]|uniref:Uncharacterized protein n=2 Tax=Lentinula aciculospora TaxID=153920 RepID=A0A9W9DQK8_9AGAR|nr:hypothetical protein J3R30DRAFT_3701809 [Lentinula aciculospora]